jgi:hypothetical protein
LSVVELGWNGDNRVFDFLPRILFGSFLHLSTGESSIAEMDLPMDHVFLDSSVGDLPPNQPLERKHGVLGVNNRPTLAGKPNQALSVFCKPTTEGVVRAPSAFSMTRVVCPFMMEKQVFVVPTHEPRILVVKMLRCAV